MGFLGVIIAGIAAWLLWDNGWPFIVATIFVAIIEFWSWGVMHNYATEEAKNRHNYSGEFYDLTTGEVDSAPNWLTVLNLLGFIIAVGLLVMGFVM
jgi:hypothetical protein